MTAIEVHFDAGPGRDWPLIPTFSPKGRRGERTGRVRSCQSSATGCVPVFGNAGSKWRRPRQPHPGTRIIHYRCFLPDLAEFADYRRGGTDGATMDVGLLGPARQPELSRFTFNWRRGREGAGSSPTPQNPSQRGHLRGHKPFLNVSWNVSSPARPRSIPARAAEGQPWLALCAAPGRDRAEGRRLVRRRGGFPPPPAASGRRQAAALARSCVVWSPQAAAFAFSYLFRILPIPIKQKKPHNNAN